MKIPKSYLLQILPIFLLCSCSQQEVKEKESPKIEITKTEEANQDTKPFDSDSIYSFELANPSPDTFKLVSSSWYFYYPFGKFSTPEEIKGHFKGKFEIEEEISPSKSDPSEKVTLYRLKMKNGFIKFFHTTLEEGSENNEMAIVSAKVTEPSIQMTNGLKVGLSRNEVKNILFSKGEPGNIRNYNNLLIATGLDGVWVHLNFEKERLKKIIIDTDYQLNEE